jgi:hypothetical protein
MYKLPVKAYHGEENGPIIRPSNSPSFTRNTIDMLQKPLQMLFFGHPPKLI